jgi:hypothetical protein
MRVRIIDVHTLYISREFNFDKYGPRQAKVIARINLDFEAFVEGYCHPGFIFLLNETVTLLVGTPTAVAFFENVG